MSSIKNECLCQIISIWNVMIMGLADHELYVIQSCGLKFSTSLHVTDQLHFFILKFYIPQSHHLYHCYDLSFILLSYCYHLISLLPIWLSINTSSFWSKSLYNVVTYETQSDHRNLLKLAYNTQARELT